MTRIIIFLGMTLISLTAHAQTDKDFYWFEMDSSYIIADNSKKCWYTLEIPTDTLFYLDKMMFIARNKDFQVNNSFVDGGKGFKGAIGDIEKEIFILKNKKNWELKYQKKQLKKRLTANEELYYTDNGKPVLIWWFEMPQKRNKRDSRIEIELQPNDVDGCEEHDVTHAIFIDFIIHGYTSVTLSYSVLDNENIEDELHIAKEIANSLNVYGSYIQLDMLERKIYNLKDYNFTDNLKLIEIMIPERINYLNLSHENSMMVSFPEKDNIYNAASILWQYKNDSTTFDDFIAERKNIGSQHDDVKLICDSTNIKRELFTGNDSYFHCQNVYLQGESIYCFVNFTATNTTYDYNIELFNELIRKITLK